MTVPLNASGWQILPCTSRCYSVGIKTLKTKAKISRNIQLTFCIMTVGMIVFELIPGVLLGFFNATPEMIEIGIPALRIIAIHFPIAAICIVFLSCFQALGMGITSMLVSFVRQLIVLLPVAYLLSLTGVLSNIWWCFPCAEICCLILSSILMIRVFKRKLKNL